MTLSDSIETQSSGAMFYRADLHVHTYGGSHDVKDETMTPENIVATAVSENISLISIADHNNISNVKQAIEIGEKSDVIVIPGIELSTAQGHLLCYLPDYPRLVKFFAGLNIVDEGLPTSRCQQSILECLTAVQVQGGFGILAHVDVASGFEHDNPGGSPHKVDVICHPALAGIELKHATSDIYYSPTDSQTERVQMGRQRIGRLGLGSRQYLARVMNSDSHALSVLGRNASNDKRVTRYKMDKPSFASLKIALEDSDARVRIEELIPQAVPHIVGIAMEGGFLDKQVIQFSRNLNCIIGGRGTGKSTTFESVRCLIGTEEKSGPVVDSEVWPDVVNFIWQDKAGQRHILARHKNQILENLDDADGGPSSFDIDCFGQGDAARISIEAQKNPLALLNYLDKFVDFDVSFEEEEAARSELLELQTAIEKAEQQVSLIPQLQRQLQTTQSALAAMQKPEVKALIELQRHLATERELRSQIVSKLKLLKNSADVSTQATTADELIKLANPDSLTLGRKEFEAIVTEVGTFKTLVIDAKQKIATGASNLEVFVNAQTAAWKTKDIEAQGKIDSKKRELEALRITFDMSYITKLANDEASHQATLKRLDTWKTNLVNVRKKRLAALARRRSARERIAMLRASFGRLASATLKEALADLHVSLKYVANAYSPDASEQIVAAMGWRTNQHVRASYLVEDLTVPSLLEAIQNKDTGSLTALKTKDGAQAFDAAEAQVVLERLSVQSVRFALERVALFDVPKLQVSKQVEDGVGGLRTVRREFHKLSLGQQQSILLALMLSANSDKPLIIDQPEDNLDGEFIYSTLVPVLRRAKERRQVIIVTHNANVAVLGDAEQIIVMRANNDHAEIVSRGSIDRSETRDAACSILEGAKEAFTRRAKMYGFEM
jgi:energy-coupling factor transporter ATP-binding protein EcfA2